jgi:cytochrome b
MTDRSGAPAAGPLTVKVWDPAVRLFHWSFAAAITAAWLTHESPGALHEWLGYTAAALAVLRIGWGFVGTRHARFRDFVRTPSATWAYALASLRMREPRFLGHNPLGAAMILLLLALSLGLAVTGYLMTTRAFFGVAWMENVHETFSNLFLLAVPLHLLGVVWESVRHHENLAKSMVTGRKRLPSREAEAN